MRRVILAAALAATFCLSQTSLAQAGGSGGAGTGASAALGGPPASGSFSVQNQPQGTPGGGAQTGGAGGAGQAGGVAQPGGGGTGGAGGTATGTARGGAGGDIATSSPRAEEETREGPASEDPEVELARLRAEVNRLRAELDDERGVRGSGREEERGTGGSGEQAEQEPQPVASAIFEGRVTNVSKGSIEVIDHETGEPYVLRVTGDTRARSGNRRIPVTRIREGSEVRASFDLISGDTYATRIDVLGKARR